MIKNFIEKYKNSNENNKNNILILFFILILLVIKFFSDNVVLTGDEPRYTHMAYSFFKDLSFNLPYDEWIIFCNKYHIQPHPAESFIRIHSPLHSILVSPFVGYWGPIGGRWAQFIIALFGFVY